MQILALSPMELELELRPMEPLKDLPQIGTLLLRPRTKAADSSTHGKDVDGSLDVCIRVEKDQHDSNDKTQSYDSGEETSSPTDPHAAEGSVKEHA
ncbi:hypothetical protein DL95DRAFT_470334 [Leptodontidium sp. 2 PMI_412]|nr:hypothetical protein DL95DRAFT_470334 [Leptodontidium sp. 2 PMI_412]